MRNMKKVVWWNNEVAGMRENLYRRMIAAKKKMRWKSFTIAASKNIAKKKSK